MLGVGSWNLEGVYGWLFLERPICYNSYFDIQLFVKTVCSSPLSSVYYFCLYSAVYNCLSLSLYSAVYNCLSLSLYSAVYNCLSLSLYSAVYNCLSLSLYSAVYNCLSLSLYSAVYNCLSLSLYSAVYNCLSLSLYSAVYNCLSLSLYSAVGDAWYQWLALGGGHHVLWHSVWHLPAWVECQHPEDGSGGIEPGSDGPGQTALHNRSVAERRTHRPCLLPPAQWGQGWRSVSFTNLVLKNFNF